MRIVYTGDIRELQRLGYTFYDSEVGNYYKKEIVSREDRKKRLTCYIDIRSLVVDFVGCREYERYFLKELEGLIKYEEDKSV